PRNLQFGAGKVSEVKRVSAAKDLISDTRFELRAPTAASATTSALPCRILRVRSWILALCHTTGATRARGRRRIVDPLQWFEVVHSIPKRIRNCREDPGNPPHQREQQRPESERTMKIPIEPLPARLETNQEATLPVLDSLPPDNNSCEAQCCPQCSTDGVDL